MCHRWKSCNRYTTPSISYSGSTVRKISVSVGSNAPPPPQPKDDPFFATQWFFNALRLLRPCKTYDGWNLKQREGNIISKPKTFIEEKCHSLCAFLQILWSVIKYPVLTTPKRSLHCCPVALKTEAARSTKTLVTIYNTTRCHNTESHSLYIYLDI
jgi:hypothetical protein